jgi:Zn finger protein HypA/HybF involved in hydrogenase expression
MVLETIKSAVGMVESEPSTYECQDCGRVFEADAPPERVYCSDCNASDVEPAPGATA